MLKHIALKDQVGTVSVSCAAEKTLNVDYLVPITSLGK